EYLVLFDIRDSFNLEEASLNTDNSISVNTNQGVKKEGINIFGVLGGYNNLEERVRFIKEINNFNVD
ncbi:17482_t:CDS:2, partial [Entrophospora sp. SA101]